MFMDSAIQKKTHSVDGYDVLQRVLTHKIRGFHDDSRRGDWAGMFDALQAMPVSFIIFYSFQVETFISSEPSWC